MRKHTRYGIRLAERNAVRVRPAAGPAEVALFHGLLAVTGSRKGFGIHTLAYFQQVYRLFNEAGQGVLLFAEWEGQTEAAVWALAFGPEAIYMYAASGSQGHMSPSLVLWEAIRWSKGRGCTRYDLWGIPDDAVGDGGLASAARGDTSDPLWGVYIFKKGFGGRVVRTMGAYDLAYRPLLYALYGRLLER
jgi:lipid II:glycine glycyltransferase (peptidoglycan interpeptide bridge formation enzyme)